MFRAVVRLVTSFPTLSKTNFYKEAVNHKSDQMKDSVHSVKGSLCRALPPRPSDPDLLFKTKIVHFATLFKTGDNFDHDLFCFAYRKKAPCSRRLILKIVHPV